MNNIWTWVLALISVVLSIVIIVNSNKMNNLADEIRKTNNENDRLKKDVEGLVGVKNVLENQLTSTQLSLQSTRHDLWLMGKEKELLGREIEASAMKIKAMEVDLGAPQREELERLDGLIKLRYEEIENLNSSAESLLTQVQQKSADLAQLELGMMDMERRIREGESLALEMNEKKTEMEDALEELVTAIEDRKLRMEAILSVEEGRGSKGIFGVDNDKKRLAELIDELVAMYGGTYPSLKKELVKALWSVVGLPQVQQLCKRESLDRGGIYKLTLREDEKVCYIGQAVSIKDRGYTHIKKMLGVESKGTERLYEYGPGDFTGEVVEFRSEDLDEAERYWMDYYKSCEIGLNKKRG